MKLLKNVLKKELNIRTEKDSNIIGTAFILKTKRSFKKTITFVLYKYTY